MHYNIKSRIINWIDEQEVAKNKFIPETASFNFIDFKKCCIGENQFITFLKSTSNLICMHICQNGITRRTIAALKRSNSASIRIIMIQKGLLRDKALEELANGQFSNLFHLSVVSNVIGPRGLISFRKHKWMQLRYLELSNNNITNKGIQALVRIFCPRLQLLCLASNRITEDGIKIIAKSLYLKLASFIIHNNFINFKAVQRLSRLISPCFFGFQLYPFKKDDCSTGILPQIGDLKYLIKIQARQSIQLLIDITCFQQTSKDKIIKNQPLIDMIKSVVIIHIQH